MSRQVRVRFAPSPTGPLHIGGVRTALFNYLFAKKNNGVFYLRIEDTDQTRFVPGAEEYIMEALEWLGIAPDETIGKNEKFGPYRQSDRKDLYQKYADQLIQNGWAYYAFDTPEALDAHRKQHEAEGKTFIYNHHNREKLDTSLVISAEETAKRIANGEHYVIRFKTPVNEILHLNDMIRGEVKFDTNLLDDKVLTNFKRYDETGEHEVEELSDTDNLIIKGNNLIALHSLKKRFAGKVKLIYIDVPYNTGSDSFGYNDSFNHSTWLTFMKNRLEIAKTLLSDDGVIFVHLDDNEVKYLGVLMDEIFERENFIELVTVVNNPRGRDYGGIANMHEFIYVYKRPFAELNLINDPDKKFKFEDEFGGFDIRELRNRNTAFHIGNRPNLVYPI